MARPAASFLTPPVRRHPLPLGELLKLLDETAALRVVTLVAGFIGHSVEAYSGSGVRGLCLEFWQRLPESCLRPRGTGGKTSGGSDSPPRGSQKISEGRGCPPKGGEKIWEGGGCPLRNRETDGQGGPKISEGNDCPPRRCEKT